MAFGEKRESGTATLIDLEMAEGVQYIGRILLVLGIGIAALGLLLIFSGKIPWLGKLPGDFLIQRKNFTLYFPLATSILLSLLLTVLFWIFRKR